MNREDTENGRIPPTDKPFVANWQKGQNLTVHSTNHRQGLESEQTLPQLSDQC